MPRIVTTVHDPVALAATCERLALPPPVKATFKLGAKEVFGWVVRLPLLAPAIEKNGHGADRPVETNNRKKSR